MIAPREIDCAAPALPKPLTDLLSGYQWSRNFVGESGGAVYRLHGRGDGCDLYVKHGTGQVADDLVAEMVRLRWLLNEGVSVPEVRHFVLAQGEAWLVTAALPGETAYQALISRPEHRAAVVDAVADYLRKLHGIPVTASPFRSEHHSRLVVARQRIDTGMVDVDDFDDEREGWTADQVWDELQHLLPLTDESVVTHGDFSLDNILLVDGVVVGCIDVGRAGLADPYQDLAILWNCLGEFGGALQARLFTSYGIDLPDERRLRFHLLLDELF